MYFDAVTMAAICAELRQELEGGRVQRVLLPSDWSIGLEIFAGGRRHQLLLSAHPQNPRLHLVGGKLSRGTQRVTPLLLLLRKYVRGGRLESIEQIPRERVVALSIAKFPDDRKKLADARHEDDEDDELDELDEPTKVELILEIVGKASNLLLVDDDNLILDCMRHVPGDEERRSLLPRAPYELPPRQTKLNPATATANGIRSLLALGLPTLARALVAGYDAISPQVSREVAFRALGRVDAPLVEDAPFEQIAEALARIAGGHERRPCVARDDDGRVVAFAPYWLSQHPRQEPHPSANVAADSAYGELEQLTGHSRRRQDALEELATGVERVRTRLETLRAELERAKRVERLRWEGEMIYGYLHELQPRQASLVVEGQTITLNPNLSGVENAQARFKEYDKAKAALSGLPELVEEAEGQLAYLEQAQTLLELADGFEEIAQIILEAQERGFLRVPRRKQPRPQRAGPLKLHTPQGALIMIGRTARQNDEVTFKHGLPDDLWLHARNMPGAHVLLRFDGGPPPEESLLRAAELAAYYSKGRNAGSVEVDISQRRHVRRIRGGQPGLVTYRPEHTLRVQPRGPGED